MNVFTFTYKNELLGVVHDCNYNTNKLAQHKLIQFIESKLNLLSNSLNEIEYCYGISDEPEFINRYENIIEIVFSGDNGIVTVQGLECNVIDVLA